MQQSMHSFFLLGDSGAFPDLRAGHLLASRVLSSNPARHVLGCVSYERLRAKKIRYWTANPLAFSMCLVPTAFYVR